MHGASPTSLPKQLICIYLHLRRVGVLTIMRLQRMAPVCVEKAQTEQIWVTSVSLVRLRESERDVYFCACVTS